MVAIDMSQATNRNPPAKRGPRKATGATTTVADSRTPLERRTEGLNDIGQLGQGILLLSQQWADAAAVGQHWSPLAEELAKCAGQNETIAKGVDLIIQVGPYGALIAAAMPLVLQVLANHHVIDAKNMVNQGIVPPEVLEAQMKAQVAQMQAEALRRQQEAIADAQKAQAEYEEFMREQAKAQAELVGANT